jgi:hypothetical protein
LLGFIRKLGGIKEEFGRFRENGYMAGTIKQILGDVRSRPGLLNNRSGQTLDEIARSARDAGFDIGDDDDFIRVLSDELQGRTKAYRIGEAEEWNAYQDYLRSLPAAEKAASQVAPELQELAKVVGFYASRGSLMKPIRALADAEMLDLDEFIRRDPRRAAHWLQSAAREQAALASEKGDRAMARAYGRMRDNLLRPLESSVPGYRDVRSEFGSVEQIDSALDAGKRFLSKTERPEELTAFAETLSALSPQARSAALLSIRDEITKMLDTLPS